jgi:hypothetical protein
MRRWSIFGFCLLLLSFLFNIDSQIGDAQSAPTPVSANSIYTGRQFVRSDRLGITFISSAQLEADDARYQNALLLGAGWTRWPLIGGLLKSRPMSGIGQLMMN